MPTVLATDVFGATPHVLGLARRLEAAAPQAAPVRVLDPYAGEAPGFADQDAAYAAFVQGPGPAAYAEHVARAATALGPGVLLVGMSAGATACWLALGADDPPPAARAALFYGTRIREHTDMAPACPVSCIWAREAHMDTHALAARLARIPGVDSLHADADHGFFNPGSPGYDAYAAEHWAAWLAGFLRRHAHPSHNGETAWTGSSS